MGLVDKKEVTLLYTVSPMDDLGERDRELRGVFTEKHLAVVYAGFLNAFSNNVYEIEYETVVVDPVWWGIEEYGPTGLPEGWGKKRCIPPEPEDGERNA